MHIQTIIVFSAVILIVFVAFVYGEVRHFRNDRPVFCLFILCGMLSDVLSFAYDMVTAFNFDISWDGFSLAVLASVGSSLSFFGAAMEMIAFLKSKGLDCSFRGFGLRTFLLALIPVALEISVMTVVAADAVYAAQYVICALCLAFATYPMTLVAFRRDDGTGIVKALRPCCWSCFAFSLTHMLVSLSAYIGLIPFLVIMILYGIAGILIVAALERGSKRWI